MRETIDPWTFVYLAYALGVGATVAMIAWAWLSMRTAEARRDRAREG
jgi:hypothetical protein